MPVILLRRMPRGPHIDAFDPEQDHEISQKLVLDTGS